MFAKTGSRQHRRMAMTAAVVTLSTASVFLTPTALPSSAPTALDATTALGASTALEATAAPALVPPSSTPSGSPTNRPTVDVPVTVQTPSTVPSTTAGSSTTTSVSSPQDRGTAALLRLSYPWQTNLPAWTIAFHPGKDGVYGYTYTDRSHIDIFVRDGMSDSLLAHVIAHELGHAVDVSLNSASDREAWQQARGIEEAAWWPGNGGTDFSTGAGDFAESFAAWQVGGEHFRSKLAGHPDQAQLQLIATLATN